MELKARCKERFEPVVQAIRQLQKEKEGSVRSQETMLPKFFFLKLYFLSYPIPPSVSTKKRL